MKAVNWQIERKDAKNAPPVTIRSIDFGQRGLSLVEVMVVIVIIVIVSTIALMQFGSSREQFRRQNVALQLKTAFERARFDSVKRRADSVGTQARVAVSTDSAAFTLSTDENDNGTTTDAGDSVTTDFSGQGVTITAASGYTTVYFNQRGEVTDGAGTTISPVFLVCNAPCTLTSNTSTTANIVLVTPTGTVNLLPGGSEIPVFDPPVNTPVTPGTQINNDVTIP